MASSDRAAPMIDIGGGVRLAVEDRGSGRPVIFLHGVLMSRAFFRHQRALADAGLRFISMDFPGHGESDDPSRNHIIPKYAEALNAVMQEKNLKDAILVGWSMGAFVAWQYLMDFGPERVSGVVVVDETPTDLKREDYDLAPLDLSGLAHFTELCQTDYGSVADAFMALMFKTALPEPDRSALHAEIMKVSPTTATSILFDQTLRDYRGNLGALSRVPHLLCFGRDEKLVSIAAAEDLKCRIGGAKLVVFEESGHCPFLEEPESFNEAIRQFARMLS